tara:strand:- start:366 stop:539 length:174 start_codon:yes stop_codon:yes gene_type:complete
MNSWMSDIRMYLLNIGTIAVSMSQIDMILKITLLILSVGYTAHKWYVLYKNSKKTDD